MRRILMAFLLVSACAPVAHAVDCDARISDGASLIKTGEVGTAASRLSETGADVHVVTVSSLEGQGNLDNLFQSYLARCRSWQVGPGNVKSNLVVFMMSVGERNSIGLYFNRTGPYAQLNHAWLGIQTNIVNPALKPRPDGQRDFSRALSLGLDEIARVTVAASQSALHSVAVAPPSHSAPVIGNTQPTDLSGLWAVLGWAAGSTLLFFVVFVVVRMRSDSRILQERKRAKQLRGRNAQSSCETGITDFDAKLEEADVQLTLLQGQLVPEDIGDLPKRLGDARNLFRAASVEYGEVDKGIYDPNRPNLSESEYNQISDFYEGINANIRKAKEEVTHVTDTIAKKRTLPEDAQSAVTAASSSCKQAADAIVVANDAGYKTDVPQGKLSKTMSALQGVRSLCDGKQYTASISASQGVVMSAQEVVDWCIGLPARIESIMSAIAADTHHVAEVEEYIRDGKSTFETLAAEFNRSSYESIHGNGTQAVTEVAAARALLAKASEAVSMEQQRLDDADSSLAGAGAAIDRAEALIGEIYSRKKHLERVRDSAKEEVETAARDINAATEYCNDHREDIGNGYATQLQQASFKLREAHLELEHQWPDWPQIAKLAKSAQETADGLLRHARSEYEASQRKRTQAATNLRDARRAFDKARGYERSNSRHVDDDVRLEIDRLNQRLQEAERSSDLSFVITSTSEISRASERAYDSARLDVARATPAPAPSSSFPSGSTGGGSSDFGSGSDSSSADSSDIGGGSIDF